MERLVNPPRDPLIDVARGIAIVLVVLGHNTAVSHAAPRFVDALFLFHVPLFFALSGFVLRPATLTASAARLARRLLLPFALAALAVGAVKSVTRDMPLTQTLEGIAWGTGQTLPWSHLWFLPALFVALLAAQWLRAWSATRAWRGALLLALLIIAALWWPPGAWQGSGPAGFAPPVGLPWSLDLLPVTLLFTWAGLWMATRPRAAFLHPLPAALALAVFVAALLLGAGVDLNERIFEPAVLALAAAGAGILLALQLARATLASRALTWLAATLGRHTLTIFLLHVSLQKALLGWLGAAGLAPLPQFLLGLATAAVSIAACVLLSAAWRRVRFSGTRSQLPARGAAT